MSDDLDPCFSNDFSILYSTSSLSLDPVAYSPGTTLHQFWDKLIESSLHIKVKDIKMRILNLTLQVNYPPLTKKKKHWSHSISDDNSSDENLYSVGHSVVPSVSQYLQCIATACRLE